jgi:catechol 2,3-dioxygenase-like lactoylglutathione lyase family enzyme
MAAPRLKGLHHIKLPVTDLETSLNWYRRVFDAEHLTRFDHYDGAGTRTNARRK